MTPRSGSAARGTPAAGIRVDASEEEGAVRGTLLLSGVLRR